MNGVTIRKDKIKPSEWIAIIMFTTSLFSASIITLNIGGFQLSIFRVLVIFTFWVVLYRSRRKQNKYLFFMLLWLLYAVISVVWIKDISAWFREVFFLFTAYTLVGYFILKIKTGRVFITTCKLFSLFIGFHNVIGYYEVITRNYNWVSSELSSTYSFVYGRIPVSVFYNSNNYATILLLGIAITVICIYYSNMPGKLFYGLIVVSSVIQLFMTLSRANQLALFIGVAFFIMCSKMKNQNRIIFYTIILIIGAISLIGPLGNQIIAKLGFNLDNGSESLRIQLLSFGWTAFIGTFGFGTGAGNLPVTIEKISNIAGGQLHMWWLEVLFSYGIVIWVMYILTYRKLLKSCFRYSRQGSFVARVFSSFIVAYLVGALSSSSVMGLEALWAAWALIICFVTNFDIIQL